MHIAYIHTYIYTYIHIYRKGQKTSILFSTAPRPTNSYVAARLPVVPSTVTITGDVPGEP